MYCRYLCPLGAGFAILGRFPLVKLLHVKMLVNPCQPCKQKKCSITTEQDGSIDYAECIQCLECVVTLDNPDLCKSTNKKEKGATRVKNPILSALSQPANTRLTMTTILVYTVLKKPAVMWPMVTNVKCDEIGYYSFIPARRLT